MSVSKQFILSKLPAFRDERVMRASKQEVLRDIIPVMLNAHKRNGPLYDRIGKYFVGADIDETCNNLYEFCRDNLRYDEEPDTMQTVSVPQGLLSAGHCDCKGFASFINGCLSAISRIPGQKINWEYCFASYKLLKKTPYHVFSVVNTGDGPIWIDPTPGSGGQDPIWWMKKTVKNSDMALVEKIAGTNDGQTAGMGSLRPGERIPSLYAEQQNLAASVLLQNASAEDLNITNAPTVSQPLLTPVPEQPAPPDNIAAVPVEKFMGLPITKKQAVIGLGALAALYFIAKPGKTVNGIGKKNKNIVPLVIGFGALGYWLYTRSKQQPVIPGSNIAPEGPGMILPPASNPPAVTVPYIEPEAGAISAARSVTAQQDKDALDRTFPALSAVYAQMTDAEIISMYNYMIGYVLQGLKLYSGPGATGLYPDGKWDDILYRAVVAIRSKYNIDI